MQQMYPKLVHLTCLAHALHNVSDSIRGYYKDVNKLINAGKEMFSKSQKRINEFKLHAPNLAIPPKPILTRWGTWLSAAKYYAKHYETISTVFKKFDVEDAQCIKEVQECLEEPALINQLSYINANFTSLVDVISILEVRDLQISESVRLIEQTREKLGSLEGNSGKIAYQKLENALNQNPGYSIIKNISRILSGDESVKLDIDLTANERSLFRYAPATSCDVERSFSQYKYFFRSNRTRLLEDNLNDMFFAHVNLNLLRKSDTFFNFLKK